MATDPLSSKVLRVIRRRPKIGATEIAARLGEETADVRLSLYRLKYARRVKRHGNTRATVYTAA